MARVHVVKQGEYLDQIAHRLGIRASGIWEHAANAELRARRAQPNMLAPGDLLHIPEESEPAPVAVVVGGTNRFTAYVPRTKVAFVVNVEGVPVADEPFVVEGLVDIRNGRTDGAGTVELEVPIDVREVRVVFPRLARAFPVKVGELDPPDERSGVRQRLEHLGYCGWTLQDGPRVPATAAGGEALDDAIRMFQRDNGLAPTGVIDDATRDALATSHPI